MSHTCGVWHRVRKYDLIEVAIKESISNPSAWWNPLTAHNWNLAAVAIAYHAPFSFLRRLLEAMQAIKINIDKSHRGLGRPLMLVAQENDLFMPDLVSIYTLDTQRLTYLGF